LLAPLACHGGWARVPLGQMFASPEAVAEAVLERLARADLDGLRALAVSEPEFRARVWPDLPASRPERNLSVDYVWTDFRQQSERHLRQMLARQGGERWRLRSVGFKGETTAYRTFCIRRKTVLVVENEQGEKQTLRLFGSLLQQHGRFKVFSYVVD
jgi:hypothetical protein